VERDLRARLFASVECKPPSTLDAAQDREIGHLASVIFSFQFPDFTLPD